MVAWSLSGRYASAMCGGREYKTRHRVWRWVREHLPNANQILAIATVILVFIGYWALRDTEKTLELSERAWVGPIDAKLDEVPQQGKDVEATVSIRILGENLLSISHGTSKPLLPLTGS
jgi:hypothetical protein